MRHRSTVLLLLGLTLGLGLTARNALAAVAANTRIVNQASLSYNDGTGVQTLNAAVTVTVNLVPGLATLAAPANQTAPYSGADTAHIYNYTITAGGNGPDTYTLTAPISGAPAPVNTVLNDPGSSTPTLSTSSVTLGASVTTSGSTATVVNVPSDGVAGPAVNGIAIGDTILVSGQVRTVTAITNTGSGIANITVGAALSPVPGAGESVFERQAFTLTTYSGTLVTAGSNVVVSVDTTANNGAGNATDQVTSTYTSGSATLVKYVRNVSVPVGGTGGQNFTIQAVSNTFYTGGVTGKTGDVLEYLLLATNTGTGPATASTLSDVLPLAYVNFLTDGFGAPADVLYVNEAAAETGLTDTAADDQATLAGANLMVHVGTGATPVAGGSIAAGSNIKVVYRVTIK
mgnify:CR=1 FL=1